VKKRGKEWRSNKTTDLQLDDSQMQTEMQANFQVEILLETFAGLEVFFS
jgi:hypothetical protein